MQKQILTPEECAALIPQWPALNLEKMRRLVRMHTRTSYFIQGRRQDVMSSVGIIVQDNYILNGKHRAVTAAIRGFNLEAYIVTSESDVINHVPHKAYGDTGIEGVLDAISRRDFYTRLCRTRNILSVGDLISANEDSLRSYGFHPWVMKV